MGTRYQADADLSAKSAEDWVEGIRMQRIIAQELGDIYARSKYLIHVRHRGGRWVAHVAMWKGLNTTMVHMRAFERFETTPPADLLAFLALVL